jgi:hypothetical protein
MHEALQGALLRQGLPAAAVVRLLDELADHFEDLQLEQEEGGSMATVEQIEARLGHADTLADLAVAEHRRGHFVARHPIWCCIVAPFPLVVACVVVCMLVIVGFGYAADLVLGETFGLKGVSGDDWPPAAVAVAQGVTCFLRFAPAIMATLLLRWKVRQAGLSWRWSWVGCGLIALVSAIFMVQLQLPQASSPGTLTIGLGFPVHSQSLLHALPPIGIAVGLWCWSRRSSILVS